MTSRLYLGLDSRGSRSGPGRRLPLGVVLSVVGSIVILGILEVASVWVIDRTARSIALEEAGRFGSDSVTVALAPVLTDQLVARQPAAVAALSAAGEALIRQDTIVHLKIWDETGTIVWSDEPTLIGQQFELADDERSLFGTQGHTVEVSRLDRTENLLERASGDDRLLEVYTATETDTGTPLLLEIYAPYDLVRFHAQAVRREFVPVMTAALIVLAVAQMLLVFSLARRLARVERRHAEALERMIDAERRRVAAQVHDGVVQDLIGISFGLSALAESTPDRTEPLSEMASSTRQAIASLRSLLDSIYPIEVPPGGWVAGIEDLVFGLNQLGVNVRFDIDDVRLQPIEEMLILRVAREALRNIASHANATQVVIELTADRGRHVFKVHDNGSGFEISASKDGHFGLRLIHDVIHEAGGDLAIESASDHGTTVTVELEPV